MLVPSMVVVVVFVGFCFVFVFFAVFNVIAIWGRGECVSVCVCFESLILFALQ